METNQCGGTRACAGIRCNWWQVKDGSVVAVGNVRSPVPPGQTLVDSAGLPGVVACGGWSCPTDAQVGANGWNVASTVSRIIADRNSYLRFKARVGNKFTAQDFHVTGNLLTFGQPATDGVIYWLAAGSAGINLPGQNLGPNKVVLLADGDIDITGNLTFGAGGFLAVLSGGNINVSGRATHIMGLYLAQGTFDTCKFGMGACDSPLAIDGSVAGLARIRLNRTFTGNTPAELFTYHPEYLTNLPGSLMRRKQFKEELAP